MEPINKDEVAKQWEQKGFSCAEWQDPPGKRWENYVHDTDELLMVIQGKVEVELNGKAKCPEPGEEVYIPAHMVHSVRNIGRTNSYWLYGYKH